MARRESDFDDFMRELEAESLAGGEAAALAAHGEHFRLALDVIRLRREQHLTQQQLAKASGVQQSEISRIERGQGNPTYRTLQALARAARMNVVFVAPRCRSRRVFRNVGRHADGQAFRTSSPACPASVPVSETGSGSVSVSFADALSPALSRTPRLMLDLGRPVLVVTCAHRRVTGVRPESAFFRRPR